MTKIDFPSIPQKPHTPPGRFRSFCATNSGLAQKFAGGVVVFAAGFGTVFVNQTMIRQMFFLENQVK